MKYISIKSLPKLRFAHVFRAPSYRTTLKSAENRVEVGYVSEGTLRFSDGGEEYVAEAGDVIVYLYDFERTVIADELHSHHTASAFVEWEYTDKDDGGLMLPLLTKASAVSEDIYRTIDSLIYSQAELGTAEIKRSGMYLSLLCAVDTANRKNAAEDMPGEQYYAARAKKYVAEHIRDVIEQKEVAGYLGISPGYLCAVFNRTQGMTLMRFVNKMKLEGVRSLMINENVTLHDASLSYGFSDPNYASRLHKQLFGYNITDKMTKPD